MPLISPTKELRVLADNNTASFIAAMRGVISAVVSGKEPAGAVELLADRISETLTLADLLGRRRVFLEADEARRSSPGKELPSVLFDETPINPNVTFDEMLRDLTSREPRLADPVGGEPRWQAVARLYREQHAFALARSTSITLTQRVQKLLSEAVTENLPPPTTQEVIARLGDFTRAYSETVYRTNLNGAYNAGRRQQVKDPAVMKVVGAFEYNAVPDSDVRSNHLAAHGLLAATTDPIWNTFTPPLGYNCRCSLRFVTRGELQRRNLVAENGEIRKVRPSRFSEARPDPGFEGRRISFYDSSPTVI